MLPLLKKRPIINSITLEPSRIEGILPLVVEYRTKVIALCQSEEAMSDPTDKLLYAMLKAATVVAGKDDYCMDYICAFRAGRVE
jgi:cobalamin-dependent methionine synthase I